MKKLLFALLVLGLLWFSYSGFSIPSFADGSFLSRFSAQNGLGVLLVCVGLVLAFFILQAIGKMRFFPKVFLSSIVAVIATPLLLKSSWGIELRHSLGFDHSSAYVMHLGMPFFIFLSILLITYACLGFIGTVFNS